MRSFVVMCYALFVVAGVSVVTPQEFESCDVDMGVAELGLSEDEVALAERFGLTTCDKIWGGGGGGEPFGVWEGPWDCADDPEEFC